MSDVEWPLPVTFHFSVKLGVSEIAFSEVSGLDTTVKTKDVRSGGDNSTVYHLPEKISYSDLVLKRALVTKEDPFFKWCNQNMDSIQAGFTVSPQQIEVTMLDCENAPLASWNFEGAYPFKWSYNHLNSMKSEVMIETISLKYWKMKREK